MAGEQSRLACRRAPDLCRSGRGGASLGGRLSRRCAMERERDGKGLVRAGEIATLVPADSNGRRGRPAAVRKLRQSRFLNDAPALKRALTKTARKHGFDVIGVARPDAIAHAKERFERFIAQGAHGAMHWL